MESSNVYEFRVPNGAPRQYLHALIFLHLSILGMLLAKLSLAAALVVSVPVLIVCAALVQLARRRVWVRLSQGGMEGRTLLIVRRRLKWETINGAFIPHTRSIPVYLVGKMDEMGIPLPFMTIRVPRSICESPEFVRAVAELAPPGHPLLARRASAT
ncbi:hypothetical protein GCM10027034_14230 [Ramlibacter solisilvae]